MKKNIVILGSTGSIGQNTLKILSKYKNQFQVKLLSTNKNLSKIIKQATEFKVKNIIITDFRKFQFAKKKYKKKNFIFYNTFKEIENLFKKKEIYYSMISVIGINGLDPTLRLIKYSKNIAIVNKKSLICGWSLIKKKLDYYKTNFLPINSEHFSIHQVIKNLEINSIKNIYLTASGGPFLKFKNIKNKKIKLNQALNHPNWVMGKKISVEFRNSNE